MYNYNARLYDPVIGRFITADSLVPNIFDPQMLNRYAYCRNYPLIYVDPTGHIGDAIADALGFEASNTPANIAAACEGANLTDVDPAAFLGPCPIVAPIDTEGWVAYHGDPDFFHCGYDGYHSDNPPTPENPVVECFYDEKGRLVDEEHEYSGCKGTHNQYSGWFMHTFFDSGGIRAHGFKGAMTSLQHALDSIGMEE